jgi:hypothetical protein
LATRAQASPRIVTPLPADSDSDHPGFRGAEQC